jgi:hypothetical protein
VTIPTPTPLHNKESQCLRSLCVPLSRICRSIITLAAPSCAYEHRTPAFAHRIAFRVQRLLLSHHFCPSPPRTEPRRLPSAAIYRTRSVPQVLVFMRYRHCRDQYPCILRTGPLSTGLDVSSSKSSIASIPCKSNDLKCMQNRFLLGLSWH